MTFVVVGCDGGCFVIEIDVAPVWVANKLAAAATAAADPTEDELFPVPGLEWSLWMPCNGLPLSDFTWNNRGTLSFSYCRSSGSSHHEVERGEPKTW